MTKVNIKGIPQIEKNIRKTFDKVLDSEQMRNQIGTFVQDRIKAEARRGKPLNNDRAQPALRKSTISRREYLSALNQVASTYKASRSNTTFTGQLIEAIKYRLMGRGTIAIEIEDSARDPYIIDRKGNIGDVDTNKEVADDLRSRGFILFSAKGVESEERILKRINSIVKTFVRRAIKINFGS